jgi:hypothetical protein
LQRRAFIFKSGLHKTQNSMFPDRQSHGLHGLRPTS